MSASGDDTRYPWLDEQVSAGATVVTASRRLARDLIETYSARQIAAGKAAWQTPIILYWPDWLSRIFTMVEDPSQAPRRLDPLSVSLLWERCLGARTSEPVLNFGGVVRQSVQAWQRLGEWDVPVAALVAAASTEDERLFAAAGADYLEQLQQNDWIDGAGMSRFVAGALAAEPDLVPKRFAMAGFDRRSPAVNQVVAVLEEQGCQVSEMPAADRARDVGIVSYTDNAAELRAAGAWARRSLDENPLARIAIVCPGLEADAEDNARLIREGLVPGWQYGGAVHRSAANLSYGRRLCDYPAVAVALLLLRWASQGLAGAELSVLLRSRFIGSTDFGGRSRLELALRSHPDREWSPEGFCAALAGADDAPDTGEFIELAGAVADASAAVASQRVEPAQCVKVIDDLLALARWPGPAPLDSAGFQLVNRWRELLNDFVRSGTVTGSVTWQEAVATIGSLAADAVWQPEAGAGAVQVLGSLEAFGMEFDRLWVCGMDATQWPPPSRPLPFVSRTLQRQRNMPDATPADTLGFTSRLLQRLMSAAPECVLSWSESRQDAELTISTLLDPVTPTLTIEVADPGWSAASILAGARTDIIADDPAPPVGSDERVRGGAYTVQRQYKEPFSAFVYGRLGVRTPDPFWTGLSPSMRGNIIHNALHNLLAGHPAQEDIVSWSAAERLRRIGSAIDAALERHGRHADAVLQRIIGLERLRLQHLLSVFLDSELRRPAFTVAEVEQSLEYQCAGIALRFQIDRVDRLADGRVLVADYKTGTPRSFLSQSGELNDMQLVAYADALDADIAGILFVNIDPREIALRGAGEGWRDGGDPEWADQFAAWQNQLHEVVAQLASGDARIDTWQTAAEGRMLNILSRLEEQKRA